MEIIASRTKQKDFRKLEVLLLCVANQGIEPWSPP